MPNSFSDNDPDSLSDFIEGIVGSESIRIEEDFGQGFVRLRSSEAERRQAAQDIRSSEDVIIELLRNSRDAGANNIYIATGKVGNKRTFIVLDDGSGIPDSMQELIFQPRITSKLDTAHMDKWGLHGRGMALFSIAENSEEHRVVYSSMGNGTAMKVALDMSKVSEKKDQSTFPYFEIVDDVYMMRGPKNIQRIVCEFAIENRKSLNVYLGSMTEIAATLHSMGSRQVSAKERIFSSERKHEDPAGLLSYGNDPETFSEIASLLGLDLSTRSSRRILDGEIRPLQTILSLIERSMSSNDDSAEEGVDGGLTAPIDLGTRHFNPRFTRPDLREFEQTVIEAFSNLSERYYLEDTHPKVSIKRSKLSIEFDLIEKDQNRE